MSRLRVCVAGATGAVGREVLRGVLAAPDMVLTGAVGRSAAGQDIGTALGGPAAGVTASGSLDAALAAPCDVLIDYTRPDAVLDHTLHAIRQGIAVVIGTSGLDSEEFGRIHEAALARGVGAVTGNFSLTATLLQHFALQAARHLDSWEVVDYATSAKPDSPSATARELADRLGEVRRPVQEIPVERTIGPKAARGAAYGGAQVHSVRLPGYIFAVEAHFGAPDERLTLRHELTAPGTPFVAGTLLAARRLAGIQGLVRGFDTLLFGPGGADLT